MKTFVKPLALGACFVLMLCADFAPDTLLKMRLLRPAEAIIGLPFTPLSFAGVARRTAYRTAVYTSAAEASAAAAASASAAAAAGVAAWPPPPPPPGPVPIGTVVQTLPYGCVPAPISGVQYMDCAGTFYRTAFQGNNVVYVATQP